MFGITFLLNCLVVWSSVWITMMFGLPDGTRFAAAEPPAEESEVASPEPAAASSATPAGADSPDQATMRRGAHPSHHSQNGRPFTRRSRPAIPAQSRSWSRRSDSARCSASCDCVIGQVLQLVRIARPARRARARRRARRRPCPERRPRVLGEDLAAEAHALIGADARVPTLRTGAAPPAALDGGPPPAWPLSSGSSERPSIVRQCLCERHGRAPGQPQDRRSQVDVRHRLGDLGDPGGAVAIRRSGIRITSGTRIDSS